MIHIDRWQDGLRFVVLDGPMSLCAYVGIPATHPLAGHGYDNLPVDAHGGLTYAGGLPNELARDDGLYWYGWDYGHAGDFLRMPDGVRNLPGIHGKEWTPELVDKDSWSALYDMKRLMSLAEEIARRAQNGASA